MVHMAFYPILVKVDLELKILSVHPVYTLLKCLDLICMRKGRGGSSKGDSSHACACTCTFMGYFNLHLLQR